LAEWSNPPTRFLSSGEERWLETPEASVRFRQEPPTHMKPLHGTPGHEEE
jgi:hypothetical protein